MIIQRLCFVVVCVCLCCSLTQAKEIKKNNEDSIKVIGHVLDEQALKNGGTLGLTPFKAGPNAEANEELDRISSMVIKGIKENIDSQTSTIQLIDSTQSNPKIALEGYVEELSRTGRLSRLMFKPNKIKLSLVGDLWLTSNGKRILEFKISRQFDPKKQLLLDVAYGMGQELARFISYNSSKEKL